MKGLLDLPRKREMSLGVYIGDTDAAVAEMACLAGFDYMRIDYEHSLGNPDKLATLIRVCNAYDVPSLVRISAWDQITKLLDFGASGIMVPDIETVEQTREAVDRCKYAPVGKRGMATAARALRYGYTPYKEYLENANDNIALCVQIESVKGVENIEEIVAVEGVDMVTVGRWDLSQSMGISGQTNHPDIIAAEEHVVDVALKHGKYPLLTSNSPEHLQSLKEKGIYCATICFDVQFITKSFNDHLARFKK